MKRSQMQQPPKGIKKSKDEDEVSALVTVAGPDYREQFRESVEPHAPSLSEVEELEHIVVNVAYQIEQLVLKFQWLRGLNIWELCEQKSLRQLLSRPRVRLAIALVQQYWEGGIPVFDDLISTRHELNLTSVAQARSGDFSLAHLDELEALVLQAAFNSIKAMRQRIKGDDEFFERTARVIHDIKKQVKKHKKEGARAEPTNEFSSREANAQLGSAKMEGAKNSLGSSWPPPLPEIFDDALISQVFMHRSAVMDASMNSKADVLNIHNERLEFKGDSVLDFIICDELYKRFPLAAEGNLSIMKASLVCNDTLFDISVMYKLHERLKVSKDLHGKIFGPSVPFPKQDVDPDREKKNKAVADVFEAYIGGVAINRGLRVVQQWLLELYEPLINEAKYSTRETASEVNKNAKNELYRKIGSADQNIEYVALNNSSPFTVACCVNGTELARAEDRSLKLAGLRAADLVLKQPDLVEKFAAIRRMIPKTAPSTGRY